MNSAILRFVVVDDHPLIRQAVLQMLSGAYPGAQLTEAANGEDAVAVLRERSADLLILDLGLPGMGGLEVLDRAARLHPKMPVLVLTMHDEDQFAMRALKMGARGYVSKELASERLLGAVRRVLAGGRWVSENLAETLAARLGAPDETVLHQRLSPREFRVLSLLAAGVTVSDIATQLALSSKTVSTYKARILEKLTLRTTADLTRYCLDHHLINQRPVPGANL